MSKDIKELNVEITKLKKHNADLRKHNAKLEAENKEWYNKALKNLIAFQDKNAECERLKQELADFKAKVQNVLDFMELGGYGRARTELRELLGSGKEEA